MEGLRDRVVARGGEGRRRRRRRRSSGSSSSRCSSAATCCSRACPGVAKTLVANAFARALGLEFRRVQFTPDMLPSDLTGTMTLRGGELAFRPGPGLHERAARRRDQPHAAEDAGGAARGDAGAAGDDRGRAAPAARAVPRRRRRRTRSSTRARIRCPRRSSTASCFKLDVGYPDEEEERQILGLRHRGVRPATLDDVQPVVEPDELAQAAPRARRDRRLRRGRRLRRRRSCARTRELPSVELGASPRAGVHLLAAAKAVARLDDRGFVTPDDVADVAPRVLRHRLCSCARGGARALPADDAVRAALDAGRRSRGDARRRARRRRSLALVAVSLLAPAGRRWRVLLAVALAAATWSSTRCACAGRPRSTRARPARRRPRRARAVLRSRPAEPRAHPRAPAAAAGPRARAGAGRAARSPATLVARRRGRHVAPAARRARRTGPLGLAAWTHQVGEAAERARLSGPARARAGSRARSARGKFRDEGLRRRGPLGLGTEFESVREYSPDDDIRQVNWRATARLGRPMTNQYRVERDRDVVCVVDCGRLMAAPLGDRTRLDVAARRGGRRRRRRGRARRPLRRDRIRR